MANGRIRWTPDLASRFREMHGYDLEPNILGLIRETGNWMKLRHDYGLMEDFKIYALTTGTAGQK